MIYPVMLVCINFFIKRPVIKDDSVRSVSLIIAAYNEEKDIESKIINSMELDYPKERIEIIVVSDGSTDKTDAIVESYKKDGIKLLRVEGRKGKTAAQNFAVASVSGEIIIFSDATTVYEPDVIKKIIRPFADPSVGCVSGKLSFRLRKDSHFGGEKNTSENYDQAVKKIESDIYSIYGANGCLYAVRRDLYEPIEEYLTSDFVIPLKIIQKGFRVVFEPEAVCYEEPCKDARGEFNRKIRTSRAGITGMFYLRYMLNPFKYFWASFGLFHHKIIRWLSPFLLILIFVFNLICFKSGVIYKIGLTSQIVLYLFAVLGYFNENSVHKYRVLTIPFNFMLINIASIVGLFQFLKGNISEAWETERD